MTTTKSQYKYDEDSVKALIEWAKTTSFPQQMRLNEGENIYDVKHFVETTLSDIKAHFPNATFNPAIKHLYQLKEKMEEE